MYNRYIPQSDGTFHRSTVPEPVLEQPPSTPELSSSTETTVKKPVAESSTRRNKANGNTGQVRSGAMQYRNYPTSEQQSGSVSSFLKGLLPKDFDTEDLIVVLLLLLISGNNAKDQNAALMTLGIYLFL